MAIPPPLYSSNLSLARIQFEQYFFQQLPADQYQPLLGFFEFPLVLTHDLFFRKCNQHGYAVSLVKLHDFLMVTNQTALDKELINIASRCGVNLFPAPVKPIEPCTQPEPIATGAPVTALEDEFPVLPSNQPLPLPSVIFSASQPPQYKPAAVSHRPFLMRTQEFDSIEKEIKLKLLNLSSFLAFFNLPYTISNVDTAFDMLRAQHQWGNENVNTLNSYLKAIQFDPRLTARLDAYHDTYCSTSRR